MYSDTVTVFNRYRSRLGDMWYPTVLFNVNLNIDRASIVSRYGENAKDNAVLNVKYKNIGKFKVIEGKPYILPKEWSEQVNDALGSTVTFADGEYFDFFIEGMYPEQPIADDDYENGFFDYISEKYDHVFAITSVSEFSVIPHLEITGK